MLYNEVVMYSLGFNGYIDCLEGLQNNIEERKINYSAFVKSKGKAQFKNNYYGTDRNNISVQLEKTKKKIVNDIDNIYSKKFLDMISQLVLPENIFVSSWEKTTYEILSNYFVNILPFFSKMDRANDNQHPGEVSHKKWADSINDLL